MTKKITDQSEETEEAEVFDVEFDERPEAQDDLFEAEKAILQAFDADAKNELHDHHWQVFIYRVGTEGKKDTPLFTCSPIELPVYDRITKQYGTGDYKSRVYRDKKLFRIVPFRCEAPINTTPELAVPDNNPVAIALQNQHVILERMLTKISEAPPTPIQQNPMEMMTIVSNMFGVLKDMMPQPTAAANSDFGPMQMFDLFSRGFEMAKENNSGGGETNVLDIIRDVLKSDALTGILTPPQLPGPVPGQRITAPRPTPTPTPRATGTGPVADTPTPEATQQIDPVVMGIVNHLQQFIPHAKRGADPALYADVILDNAPRDIIKHVVTYPDIEVIFQNSNPEIAANWDWFSSLLTEILIALDESEAPEVAPGQVDLTGYPEDGTAEEIQGETIPSDQASDVPEPDEQPATGGANGDPERSGRDEGNATGNDNSNEGGKEEPGS